MQGEKRIKQNTRRFVDKSCRAKRRVRRKWRINKAILWIATAYSIRNLPKWVPRIDCADGKTAAVRRI